MYTKTSFKSLMYMLWDYIAEPDRKQRFFPQGSNIKWQTDNKLQGNLN